MRRSPRSGWCTIELRDGRWHTAAVGDREAMRALFMRRVSDLLQLPTGCPGHAVATLDAHGQRRDDYPSLPRLHDAAAPRGKGARIEWPTSAPGPDGAEPVLWQPRPAVTP